MQVFKKYDDKQSSTFSRYNFEDMFPNVVILTWCILAALDQMCRVVF